MVVPFLILWAIFLVRAFIRLIKQGRSRTSSDVVDAFILVLWHQKLPIILLPLLCFYTGNIPHRLYYLKKLLESLSILQPVGAAVDLLKEKVLLPDVVAVSVEYLQAVPTHL